MSKRSNVGIQIVLAASMLAGAPALAQYYVNPYCAYPNYNNHCYRGYAPYGYGHYHTVRNVAVGATIGAAAGALVGLLASPHGHRYY